MNAVYVIFRSVTHGQRAAELLEHYGVSGRLRRSPRALSPSGCAYALVLRRREQARAEAVLRREGPVYSGPYLRQTNGSFVPAGT